MRTRPNYAATDRPDVYRRATSASDITGSGLSGSFIPHDGHRACNSVPRLGADPGVPGRAGAFAAVGATLPPTEGTVARTSP
jgi:hypothetical protein